MTRPRGRRAAGGLVLGVLLVAGGVGFQVGPGWGVVVVGVCLVLLFLLGYDVEEDG